MPEPDSNESATSSPFELPPLAQLGAVTGRFVHDLANDISSASTLLTLISEPDTPGAPPAKEDLDELTAALERAVTQIHNFGATVRSLRPAPEPHPYSLITQQIQALFEHYQIPYTTAPSLKPETEILCHPTWLLHCLDYAARLQPGKNTAVTLSVVPAKSVTPPADFYSIDKPTQLFQATFQYAGKEASSQLASTTPDNQPYFATHELMRHMRGFLLLASQTERSELSFHLSTLLPLP